MSRRQDSSRRKRGDEYTKNGVDKDSFSITFFETTSGACPLRQFLDQLERTDPGDHRAIVAGLAKLRDRRYHREPLSKALGDGLFELRHVGKLNTRVLYFFQAGRQIIAVHGIRNKGQKIPKAEIETAHARMRDWLERFGK